MVALWDISFMASHLTPAAATLHGSWPTVQNTCALARIRGVAGMCSLLVAGRLEQVLPGTTVCTAPPVIPAQP